MKKLQKIIVAGVVVLSFVSTAFAGKMSFPQDKSYGMKPDRSAALLADDIKTKFKWYKDQYLKVSGDQAYIEAKSTHEDNWTITVSEAHGYGMMLMAIMDDEENFDKLLDFYYDYQRSNYLMEWKVWDDGSGDGGSATDGDMDIAYALLLADKQWGGDDYKSLAENILNGIWEDEMYNESNLLPAGGDTWDSGTDYWEESYTRPSDWMTGHFNAFDGVGHGDWSGAAASVYSFYEDNKDESTGLVPDFFYGWDPCPAGDRETSHDGDYHYNACRVPLRFAMDYALTGSGDAKSALNTIGDWINSETDGEALKIKNGYSLDGDGYGSTFDISFAAPFGAGLIATDHQDLMDDIWSELLQTYNYDEDNPYGPALSIISMLVMSGNWWGPDSDNSNSGGLSDSYVIFDNFENEHGDDNDQTFLGAANGISWGDELAVDGDSLFYNSKFIGGGFWYGYADDGASSIENGSGEDVIANFNNAVNNDMLDIVLTTNGKEISSGYGFAAIEVPIMASIKKDGDKASTTDISADLSKMDAVIIRYESDQDVWLYFGTEDVSDEEWGSWGRLLPKTSGMVTDTIVVGLLIGQPSSPVETSSGSWAKTGAIAVNTVGFEAPGEEKDIMSTNLKVDYIHFNGMDYSDFGITWRDPATPISKLSIKQVLKSGIRPVVNSNGISVDYSAVRAGVVTASLYSVAGRQIAVSTNRATAGINSLDFSTGSMANGVYIVKLAVDGVVSTSRINVMK